jgi:hypothetical protein
MTDRSHSSPFASTFAHSSGGKYIALRSSFSPSGFAGRPRDLLFCSMAQL